ncbi:MAG: aminotransferase class III-fold pyridoxal phosphate-dependent enzyme [Actinomycetota bacterium]|nr:aminotransferase class III-fold pyridoxal phosphate-dependent enzyme [Actinomycetota bacterium]
MEETKTGHISPLLVRATGVRAARGEGAYLFDGDGRRYLDFTSGIGVTSTGHCHPKVVEAVRRQAGRLIHGQYTTVLHPLLDELSDRLAGLMPGAIDTFFYVSAGTEAVEAAVRLARHATRRSNVVVFQGGFHGRTTASLSMTTSKAAYGAGLQPLMGGVFVAPFPYAFRYGWAEDEAVRFCLRELEYLLATQSAPEETAAMLIEPVLGEGGYVPAPPGFLEGVRTLSDHHGILLIVDEVQTGVGRTGRFWGHEHSTVVPDVLIVAKGLASGMPLSAMAAPHHLMAQGWPGSQGGTYGGNAVSCAAALATLDVVEQEGLVKRSAELGERLLSSLCKLQNEQPAIGDVRGRGLMVGVEFTRPDGAPDGALARTVLEQCESRGLLMLPCGTYGNVVRWIPPLVVNEEELERAEEIFAASVEEATG